ncbi:MAG: prepilin-type N-terminal cleavage/methylation domain-containing protein [Gammaproteobacteria bacterium]|nr:prepilin-type N-terminal cleavage/methylation domain-containing protein [Gammaproteobacteria bacterium]
MQILVIGKKNRLGFTLIELLMVLCIIGVTSTYIFLNTSILNFIKIKENPIESNFKVLAEESIIRGKSIQWFASSNGSKFYAINQNEELLEEIFIDEFNLTQARTKDGFMIRKSNGRRIVLEDDLSEYPLITFYPSGENSGAIIYIADGNFMIEIYISQNGKITKEIKDI